MPDFRDFWNFKFYVHAKKKKIIINAHNYAVSSVHTKYPMKHSSGFISTDIDISYSRVFALIIGILRLGKTN